MSFVFVISLPILEKLEPKLFSDIAALEQREYSRNILIDSGYLYDI